MTTDKKKNMSGPLQVAQAADRIVSLIASAPDESAIAERIRAAVAEERAALQAKIDALVARVPDPAKLPGVVLALLDPAGLCGFSLGAASENDSAPVADGVPELPAGAREYHPGPVAQQEAARRGQR